MTVTYKQTILLCIIFISSPCPAYSSSTPTAEIPIVFDHANIPMVEMAIDNHHVKFYLDTGARGLHLPKAIADTIHGVKLTGRKVKSVDLAGKIREDAEFIIPEMRMNGMIFRNVIGQYLSDWGVGNSEFQLPVIGLDVLQQKELVIDFPRKRLLMSDAPIAFDTLYRSAQDLQFARADEGLVVSAHIGRHEWPFVLDCAASISIIKASASIDKALIAPCTIDLPGGRCEAVSAHVDCGKEMIVLQLIRMPLPEQFKPMGVIGYDFFSQCALYLSKNHDTIKIACKKQDSSKMQQGIPYLNKTSKIKFAPLRSVFGKPGDGNIPRLSDRLRKS